MERGSVVRAACDKQHKNKFVPCVVGVVYSIPLTCKKVYIGQTGRCINDRLREHACSTRASPSGNLAVHCDRCGCTPVLEDTTVLGRHRHQRTREITEAFHISRYKDNCVSAPSIALYDCELAFLRGFDM